eukprot:m.41788 g.41788  ORF g.41788 m.41788 type:complete len:85 (-) comp6060_c0_seq2:123-377(-)
MEEAHQSLADHVVNVNTKKSQLMRQQLRALLNAYAMYTTGNQAAMEQALEAMQKAESANAGADTTPDRLDLSLDDGDDETILSD